MEAKPLAVATDEAAAEQMADAIRRISDGTRTMMAAGLNKRAVAVLLRDATGVGIGEINKVLSGLADLAKYYTDARRKK